MPFLSLFLLFGFYITNNPESSNLNESIYANYGTGSLEHKTGLNLLLFNDGHFSYADFTQKPALEVKGTWSQVENKIELISNNTSSNFPSQWKTDKNYPCIKSRKGIAFYRICKK